MRQRISDGENGGRAVSPPVFNNITGVILAGGRSSRFGTNKALALWEGRPLVTHVVETMSRVFPSLLLVTNTPGAYSFLNLPMVRDRLPYAGPLGGIWTALKTVKTPEIFVTACDMPGLQEGAIRKILQICGQSDAVLARSEGNKNYLLGRYCCSLSQRMERTLQSGRLAMSDFCDSLATVRWVDVEPQTCWNVNTPDDLREWEAAHVV